MNRANFHPADQDTLRVSMIIPTLNEASMLTGLLDSVVRQDSSGDGRICEIIVVDAGSTDATVDIAQASGCTVIDADEGFVARSRNIGAKTAVGDVLAFVDADCVLPPDWLRSVTKQLREDSVVAVGCAMAQRKGSVSWVEQAWFEFAHYSGDRQGSVRTDWLATFNLAVFKPSFDAVGGFDESLRTCEDVELGYRLGLEGKLKRLQDCRVIHLGESRSLVELFRRESWRGAGALTSLRKHRMNLREVISFLIPIVVITTLLGGIAFSIVALMDRIAGNDQAWTGVWLPILLGLIPLIALIIYHRVRWQMFGQCLAVAATYYLARVWGMFVASSRVARED